MKKYLKIILMLAIIAVSAFGVRAYATSESSITIDKKTYINTGDRREAKFHTTKGYGYCITPSKVGAAEGTSLNFTKYETDGGLLYLLKQAGNSDNSYLATQLAIWKYYNGFTISAYNGTSVMKQADALAAEAKKHANDKSEVAIKLNGASISLTSDNAYYKSGAMSAVTTGASNYTVSVSGVEGVQLLNASGTVVSNGTTFKSGEKFYVRVASNKITQTSNIKVVVATTGKIYVMKRYSPSNNQKQDLVVLSSTDKKVNASATLKVTPVKRSCEIVNGTYYGRDGSVVDKTTYSIQCERHVCEKVGDVYFGREGKQVEEVIYHQQCDNNVCKKVGDKYYGKDGTEVEEVVYHQQCDNNVCKKVGDKYFGKDGTEVDSTLYSIQCERHVCEKVGNTYFGLNGTEVSADQYTSECVHKCEVYNNQYYGENGTVVTEETYRAQCEAVVVPVPDTNTSALQMGLYVFLGTSTILGGIGLAGHYRKSM